MYSTASLRLRPGLWLGLGAIILGALALNSFGVGAVPTAHPIAVVSPTPGTIVQPPMVAGTPYGVDPAHATTFGRSHAHACLTTAPYRCYSGWRDGGNLGHGALNAAGTGNLTWNAVMAPADGTYPVTFFYWNGDPNGDTTCPGLPPPLPKFGCRPAQFMINGTHVPTIFQMPCTSTFYNDWSQELSDTLMLPLKAGSNSIQIYSTTADVVDLDEIVVNTGSATPPPVVPAGPPTNITATAGGGGQATISWTAPANNGGADIIAYAVDHYSAASGTSTVSVVTGTSETVSGLTPNSWYIFTVTDYNPAGWSPWGSYSQWLWVT